MGVRVDNRYVFKVHPWATKVDIRSAIENVRELIATGNKLLHIAWPNDAVSVLTDHLTNQIHKGLELYLKGQNEFEKGELVDVWMDTPAELDFYYKVLLWRKESSKIADAVIGDIANELTKLIESESGI